MLTINFRTAWIVGFALFWAVLLSSNGFSAEKPLTSLESGLNDLIYSLSRSVVTIESSRRIKITGSDGSSGEAVESFVSSGIVCDTFGHILTAATNVAGQDRILVSNESHQFQADVVGIDYFSDLALLKTKTNIGEPAFLSEKQLCAGQMVVGIGNAYGLRASPTIGFCAGIRPDGTQQFSLSITSSSIGGGVFDLSGKLLGIIVGTIGPGLQMSLAVPGYQIPSIVNYLLKYGDRRAGYVGVSTADIEMTPPIEIKSQNRQVNNAQGSDRLINRGVIVTYVAQPSPAYSAGLQQGDLITTFAGQPATSAAAMASFVRRISPGSPIEITYLRNGRTSLITIIVGEKKISRESTFWDLEQFNDRELPVDSLQRLVDYLKREVGRIENRLQKLH